MLARIGITDGTVIGERQVGCRGRERDDGAVGRDGRAGGVAGRSRGVAIEVVGEPQDLTIREPLEDVGGEVIVEGRSTLDWDAIELRRRIGYVLQDGGLFPHMSVAENVSLPLTLADTNNSRSKNRTDEMLSLVGLDPAKFAARYPHELSGGQRQRVGVTRALVSDPDLLLLDEPFGALDAITRNNLQREFARLVRELGKTAVFVTHDLHEAMILATRIALMDNGKIVLNDTPANFRNSDLPLVRAYLDTVLTVS